MSDSVVQEPVRKIKRDISLATYDLYGDDAWEIVYIDNTSIIHDRIVLTCVQIARLVENDFGHNQ